MWGQLLDLLHSLGTKTKSFMCMSASKLDEMIRILLVNQLQCLVVPGCPEAQILEDLPSQESRKYLFVPNLKLPFASKSSFKDKYYSVKPESCSPWSAEMSPSLSSVIVRFFCFCLTLIIIIFQIIEISTLWHQNYH